MDDLHIQASHRRRQQPSQTFLANATGRHTGATLYAAQSKTCPKGTKCADSSAKEMLQISRQQRLAGSAGILPSNPLGSISQPRAFMQPCLAMPAGMRPYDHKCHSCPAGGSPLIH